MAQHSKGVIGDSCHGSKKDFVGHNYLGETFWKKFLQTSSKTFVKCQTTALFGGECRKTIDSEMQ
jgi:hypothetical protein